MEEFKDYKNFSNNVLAEKMQLLLTEFENTKETIVKLTYHLESVEKQYKELNNETKKRLGNVTG